MFQKKNTEASLSEELPYWEFQDQPRPHLILNDGSLVAGLRLSLIDIECFDDVQVNQLAIRLRGVLNSISEIENRVSAPKKANNLNKFLRKYSSNLERAENVDMVNDETCFSNQSTFYIILHIELFLRLHEYCNLFKILNRLV